MHYLTKTGVLSRRGWTLRRTGEFLGEPDEVRPNPYGGPHPMRLFARHRVEQAEKSPAFWRWPRSGVPVQERPLPFDPFLYQR